MLRIKRFTILLLSLIFLGCNSSSDSNPKPNIEVSDCQATKAHRISSLGDALDNNHTYVSYQYDNGQLKLTHYNVAFNCDERGIEATSKMEDNTITIIERQHLPKDGGMRCMCLFDVSITLDNIEAKNYTIDYDDGISNDIHFDIDLSTNPQGIKSFERHNYPYGQETTTPPTNPIVKKLILDEFYNINILPDSETKIVKTQNELDTLILQLKEIGDNKVDEWAKTLEESQIDFDESYLITYTFEEGCIYEYLSTVGINTDNEVTIRLNTVGNTCATAMAQYYLAYQVSKEVKHLTIKVVEHEPIKFF